MKNCIVCGMPVDWLDIAETWDKLNQVDRYGVESLTENEQVVYDGECHLECMDKLS